MSSTKKIKQTKNSKTKISTPVVSAVSEVGSKGEIDIRWSRVRGASFYVVQLSSNSEKPRWIQVDIITRSPYTVSGLKSGKKYCFRVAAVNSTSRGDWSEIIIKNAP